MKCVNECGKDVAGRGKYCSDTCKTVYNRNKKRNKLDPSVTVTAESVTVSVTPDVVPCQTITDACGKVHPIDFEGRREVQGLLDSWAEGKDTAWQRRLGKLHQQYQVIKGINVDHYLGLSQ